MTNGTLGGFVLGTTIRMDTGELVVAIDFNWSGLFTFDANKAAFLPRGYSAYLINKGAIEALIMRGRANGLIDASQSNLRRGILAMAWP